MINFSHKDTKIILFALVQKLLLQPYFQILPLAKMHHFFQQYALSSYKFLPEPVFTCCIIASSKQPKVSRLARCW